MSEVLTIFGERLAELTQRPVLACKGLIRLAIKDDGKTDELEQNSISYQDFDYVLEHALKSRLEKLNITNFGGVISDLRTDLKKKQAIFTMQR